MTGLHQDAYEDDSPERDLNSGSWNLETALSLRHPMAWCQFLFVPFSYAIEGANEEIRYGLHFFIIFDSV